MILMLNSSKESDRISEKMSHEMMMSVLKFIGTHDLHTRFPRIWTAVRQDFDSFMAGHAEESKSTVRRTWLVKHRHALRPLMDIELAMRVDGQDSSKHNLGDLEKLFASHVGGALFKAEALDCHFSSFLTSAQAKIRDTEIEGYTEISVRSLKQSLLAETKHLVGMGHSQWRKKPCNSLASWVRTLLWNCRH